MTTGLWLAVYSIALAFCAPSLLGRLARAGLSPRMEVAAWLTAIATTVIGWATALVLLGVAALDGLRNSASVALCLQIFGIAGGGGLLGLSGSTAVTICGSAVSVIVLIRTARSAARLKSRSREHAYAVRLVGRPTARPGVVVVDADRPAAYCVSGRPPAIVVTSAACSSLSSSELAAVLAHEEAHISGHHHQLLIVLRALAAALPRVPMMRLSAPAVGALLEMCADDAAVRRHGVNSLIGGIMAMASTRQVPAEGLAAAGTATAARAVRLTEPMSSRAVWAQRALLGLAMGVMLGTPGLIELMCHH